MSLLELANRLQVDPDNAARRLYMMRKSNIFSYSLTDSKIYVNILKKGLASSLMRWFAKNSPDYIMTLELFLKWLWFVAEKVNELLVTNVRCAATRVLDMWRMGNIIAAMTGSDPGLDSPSVYTSQDSVCEVNSSLKNMDPDARQRILTDFICDYYIGNLAPRRYADRKPINCILTDHSVFLKEIERLFYHVQLPIYVIDGPDDALNSKRFYESGDRNSVNIEYTGARIPSANMVKLFYNDVESLNCDPRLDDIVKSVSLSHKLPISNSTQLRFSFLWLKSLYVAKILHGLASHWLSQQDWASTGLWAKYANFHFDCIVRSVNTCLVMQVK